MDVWQSKNMNNWTQFWPALMLYVAGLLFTVNSKCLVITEYLGRTALPAEASLPTGAPSLLLPGHRNIRTLKPKKYLLIFIQVSISWYKDRYTRFIFQNQLYIVSVRIKKGKNFCVISSQAKSERRMKFMSANCKPAESSAYFKVQSGGYDCSFW